MVPLTEEDKELQPLTMDEAREVLRIGRNSMLKLLNSGAVRATRIGAKWLITREALKEFLARGTNANTEGK